MRKTTIIFLSILFPAKKDEYDISSFGVSVTTLEEVFLKVGEGETLSGVEAALVKSLLLCPFLYCFHQIWLESSYIELKRSYLQVLISI